MQLQRELVAGSGRVLKRDVEELSKRTAETESRLRRLPRVIYRRARKQLRLLMGLVGDYVAGRYREVPWRAIATAAFAVLYFLNPFDLIPDFIPGIGFIDDATLISMAVAALRGELRRYESSLGGKASRPT